MNPLKKCRLEAGLTQQYVALTLGVKAPSVCNWESGKTAPTTDKLKALAKLYNVSVDDLIEERTPEKPKKEDWRVETIEMLERLPDDKLAQVLEYARFIANKK